MKKILFFLLIVFYSPVMLAGNSLETLCNNAGLTFLKDKAIDGINISVIDTRADKEYEVANYLIEGKYYWNTPSCCTDDLAFYKDIFRSAMIAYQQGKTVQACVDTEGTLVGISY